MKNDNEVIPTFSKFGANVFKLITGNVAAQLITIGAMPIITRMYTPDDFGIYQLFVSITSVLIVVAALQYDMAIMLPPAEEDAVNVTALSVIVVTIFSLLTLPIIGCFRVSIAYFFEAKEMAPYLWLAPLAIFTGAILQVFTYWSSRQQQFGRVAFSSVIANGTTSGVKIACGAVGWTGPGGLIGGYILGPLVGTAVLVGRSFVRDIHLLKEITLTKIKAFARRYRKFPIYSTWSVLLNNLSIQLPSFLLAFYFSPAIVGLYSLGYRAVKTPMNFIASAIAKVFYQKASDDHARTGSITMIVEEVSKRLIAFGLFPMLLLAVVGKELFVIVFGQKWAEAGVYMQIMVPWIFLNLIASPLSTTFNVLEKQRQLLLFNTVLFLSRIVTLVIGGLLGSPRLALGLFSISGAFIYGWLSFWIMRKTGVAPLRLLARLKEYLLCSGALLVPLLIITKIISGHPLLLLLTVALAGIIYLMFLFRRDPVLQGILLAVIGKAGS